MPKKLVLDDLSKDQLAGKNITLKDKSGKLICRTDIIPAEREDGHPTVPDLTPDNVAMVRRLNSGQLDLIGGVAIENLELPRFSTRQLTAGCAVDRDGGNGLRKLGLLTNAHAAVDPNPRIGLVTNPGDSPAIGVLSSPAVESDLINAKFRALLDTKEKVEAHLDAAIVEVEGDWAKQKIHPGVDGLPPLGQPYELNLDSMGPVGKEVVSVGQQSGLQTGRIFAYGFAWLDVNKRFHWTDYLIYSKTERFSQPGDSGKLIVTADGARQPLALHWGGSFSLLRPGGHKEWWGYSTDIGRVLRALNAKIHYGESIPAMATGVSKPPIDSGSSPASNPITPGH